MSSYVSSSFRHRSHMAMILLAILTIEIRIAGNDGKGHHTNIYSSRSAWYCFWNSPLKTVLPNSHESLDTVNYILDAEFIYQVVSYIDPSWSFTSILSIWYTWDRATSCRMWFLIMHDRSHVQNQILVLVETFGRTSSWTANKKKILTEWKYIVVKVEMRPHD